MSESAFWAGMLLVVAILILIAVFQEKGLRRKARRRDERDSL
jgi:hypothetical protein